MSRISRLDDDDIKLNYNYKGRDEEDRFRIILGKDISDQKGFFITQKERNLHTHIIGATGKGKSKFLEILIRNDIESGHAGLCVIDPTGKLYKDILNYAVLNCQHIADRFILLDFSNEKDFVTGFNPIRKNYNLSYDRQMLMSAIQKAWGQSDADETPRMNRWLANILSLIILNNLTLLESLLIADTSEDGEIFRKALLKNCYDPYTLQEWKEFEIYTPREKREAIESSFNRLARFLSDETIRKTIGQQTHILDFKKILDQGKILLVNLQAGTKVHSQYTNLIGILVIQEIVRVANLRNDDDHFVKPFYLCIDEFGHLITKEVADALDLVRKRKLFFILAHQHFAQIENEKTPTLKSSILTNCQVKISFGGLNSSDAMYMADEFGYYDFDTPKDEIWGDEYEPVLKQIETTSTTEGYSEDHGESHSTQSGRKNEGGTTRQTDSGGMFDTNRTISKTSGTIDSRSDSSSHSSSKSHSKTTGTQWVTDHIKHRVLRSRTFASPEELQKKNASKLTNLSKQHAVIKIEENAPLTLKISDVTSYHLNDFTFYLLDEFKSKSFKSNQDCYIPLDKIGVDFLERERKIMELLGSINTTIEPIIEEKPQTVEKKPPQKRPRTSQKDDSPFE